MIFIAKQLTNQRYIFKIKSGRLRKAKWNLSLSTSEARKSEELVSLADSQIIRWLDELNGFTEPDELIRSIKSEIKTLRQQPSSIKVKRRIAELYGQIDAIQFKPDYVCVVIEKNSDYIRACQGFTINDLTYHRLLGTSGGVKNSTIVFIADRHGDEIRRRIENGRNPEVEMVPAKLEAYKALTCSASMPVSFPSGVLIVKDCETQFLSDVVYLDDEGDGEPIMELRTNVQLNLNASDGFGLMLPSLAERWAADIGIDYLPSGVNTRFAWEKGMVFTFDFHEFAEKVAGKYEVVDAWGDIHDIRDIDLILTTSMVKLWDSYSSCEDYVNELGDQRAAMKRMCMKLDLYWCDALYDMTEKSAVSHSRVRTYIAKTNLAKYIDKTYDDTIRDEEHAAVVQPTVHQVIPIADEYSEEDVPPIDDNKRVTYICEMHKARALANVYYWNRFYEKHNIKNYHENFVPDEWALAIIGTDELNRLKALEQKQKERSELNGVFRL